MTYLWLLVQRRNPELEPFTILKTTGTVQLTSCLNCWCFRSKRLLHYDVTILTLTRTSIARWPRHRIAMCGKLCDIFTNHHQDQAVFVELSLYLLTISEMTVFVRVTGKKEVKNRFSNNHISLYYDIYS